MLPRAVQISLRDTLDALPSFCFEDVDVTAYPYAAIHGRATPCAEILKTWSAADRSALLVAAGHERLRIKAVRMAAGIRKLGRSQVFYEEIMSALGYKHNRTPFRRLARCVPLEALREEAGSDRHKAYSVLLGIAGLLPSKSRGWDTDTRAFVRSLWDNWWKQRSNREHVIMPPGTWRMAGLRPHNSPVRRMAAAAALFAGGTDIEAELLEIATTNPESWFRKARILFETTARMEYWQRRLSFSGQRRSRDTALVGAGRIATILSNVVVPFFAAVGVTVTPVLELLPGEEDNNLIRQTAYALFGRDHNPAMYHSGLKQQGLLQVFHDFCMKSKSGCRDCALLPALETPQCVGISV